MDEPFPRSLTEGLFTEEPKRKQRSTFYFSKTTGYIRDHKTIGVVPLVQTIPSASRCHPVWNPDNQASVVSLRTPCCPFPRVPRKGRKAQGSRHNVLAPNARFFTVRFLGRVEGSRVLLWVWVLGRSDLGVAVRFFCALIQAWPG